METKKVIVIVGQCPQETKDITTYVKEIINDSTLDTEVNIFDLPRVGGQDSGWHEANIYVHRYACPSAKLCDAVKRDWEIVRDIVALGPSQVILQKSIMIEFAPLVEHISDAMKTYGIKSNKSL